MEAFGFRIGDRVMFRVTCVHPRLDMTGDIIGIHPSTAELLIGWADGSQSWELPIELRKV